MANPAAAPDTAAYLKVSQVATRLGLSPRQVYDLIAMRELPAHRFGKGRGGMRVKITELDAFEKSRQLA